MADVVTIQEVAKEAQVSVATVSRYINNPDIVSGKTKYKVENAIRELKYEPSFLGRNLRKAESKLLIVLIPGVSNPFYSKIVNGIEDTALQFGYHILLGQTDSNSEREEIYFNLIKNQLADGIITMDPAVNRDRLAEIASDYPLVQCSEYDEKGMISFVSIDNEKAAYQAVEHLILNGHEKIALVNSNEKFLYARERKQGYLKALCDNGLPMNTDWVFTSKGLEFNNGRKALQYFIQQEEKPTAIFSVSDILAVGVLKECNVQGLNVPTDMALVGFDKIDFSNMTNPSLTTIAQPMYQMGKNSAEMLIKKIKGEELASIILDHELIIRESS